MNTSRAGARKWGNLLTYDSPCFRGRLPLKIRFTIFTLRLRLLGYIGWFQFLKGDLSLVLMGRRRRLRLKASRSSINLNGPPWRPWALQPL